MQLVARIADEPLLTFSVLRSDTRQTVNTQKRISGMIDKNCSSG